MRVFDKILLVLVLLGALFIYTDAKAEIQPFEMNIPTMCGDTEKLLKGLRDSYDEEMVMLAPSENEIGEKLFHSLWINYGNKTWTFIVVNKPKGITCVLASGDTLQMMFPSKGI